ncbi:MAG: helix-turn-helix domain-containing protein [Thermodesulfobacteriota bacterium]|jgi:transposase
MKHGPLTRKGRRGGEEIAAHAHDAKALRRAQALLWREKGESARAVAERLGVSRRPIFTWGARCRPR